MAGRSQQTHAKRARELAVKERRERKRLKKAEVAALRAAGVDPYAVDAVDDGTRAGSRYLSGRLDPVKA